MTLVADYGLSSDEGDSDSEAPPPAPLPKVPIPRLTKPAAIPDKPTASKTQNEDTTDEVLEDFVKKTNYGDTPLEKPPPKPTQTEGLRKMKLPTVKGKIQISIPTLQDSDSDDDKPQPKKVKSSAGAAGFLGSLPAPRGGPAGGGASSTATTKPGKEATRAFIPYTLTKHKPAAKPAVKRPGNAKPKLTDAYSDSDEDMSTADNSGSGNFFSLDSGHKNTSHMSMGVVNSTPSLSSTSTPQDVIAAGPSHQPTEAPAVPKITAASLYNMSNDIDEHVSYDPMPDTEHEEVAAADQDYQQAISSHDVNSLLQDEQFLRLQGKKQRGKEAIEFIDVHTDDQKASELDLVKNLSEEVDPAAFAHRKKGEGPSGQQKRKHQITYLAFQAKERELELRNTWAANKATKQQTQAKYGF